MFRKFFLAHIILLLFLKPLSAEKVDKINLSGNERITLESIMVFGKIDLNDDFNEEKLNNIIKNLYDTNFFKDIKVNVKDRTLNIIISREMLLLPQQEGNICPLILLALMVSRARIGLGQRKVVRIYL